ncbi:hypothetical protein H8356DRAFT_431290 [Neocallimastix lanati (nom. inval.)]|nr:hypothetical protein H8356DRAFT_431290 [Neocallimastix sp. JGI-2020a]
MAKGKPQPADKSSSDDIDKESKAVAQNLIYEAKIQELTEKIEIFKQKNDILQNENTLLGQTQAASSQNKKDIVEFLNIKVVEHEQHITELLRRIKELEDEKIMIKENRKIELEKLQQEHDEVVTNLNIQNTKYKTELDELTKFKANKKKMETEMEDLRKTIIENEEEYKKTIYNMEKKMLQDKTKLRKEMLQKVNEVVLNFQKVADQQIAETTKRAIQENIIINSQLKKMSEKTVSLLSENQMLQQRNEKLKTANVLLAEIEKIIGKKNKTNQQIMKWIIEQKNLPYINIDKIVEKEIFRDVEKNNIETFKTINEKNSANTSKTTLEKKEMKEENSENSDNQNNKKQENDVNGDTEKSDTEKSRSGHIIFQLNSANNNNMNNSKKNLVNDKNVNKKDKNDNNTLKNKNADKENKSSNSLESTRSLSNSETEIDTKNIMEEEDTKNKLVLHKMLTNSSKKLNNDIDLINRAIRLQELVNMLTSFFLFFPENNNYPFAEIYDEHRHRRQKKEIKDFIDKEQVMDNFNKNIKDSNNQLIKKEENHGDSDNESEKEGLEYDVEINEKYEKSPESRNIHIYDTDDLSEVINKMKALVKKKNLTTYDQEAYFKKLIDSKLKNFLNARSVYSYRKAQTKTNPASSGRTK